MGRRTMSLSGLEGGMPSTCSSIFIASIFSPPRFVVFDARTPMTFHCITVCLPVQHLQENQKARLGVKRGQQVS